MTDITAVGELLIDFTEAGLGENGRRLFEQNPGGAPANLLTLAARLGFHTAFAGKVGRDMHGIYLKSVLEHEGIDTRGLILSDEAFTTLAFVALSEEESVLFPSHASRVRIRCFAKTSFRSDCCAIHAFCTSVLFRSPTSLRAAPLFSRSRPQSAAAR